VAAPGGASYKQSVFTIVASGEGIGGTNDDFHYIYQPATGSCFVSAEVATEKLFHPSARAGVMVRNSLDAADMEVSVLVTPYNGILFESRSTYDGPTSTVTNTGPLNYQIFHNANNSTTTTTANSDLLEAYWVRVERSGDTFTGSYSSNGVTWTTIGTPATMAMDTNVFIGLAVTSGSDGALSSAMLENVSSSTSQFAAVHWEGDLNVNLQASDLSASSAVWTTRTSNTNGVGNFKAVGGGDLKVVATTYNSHNLETLNVNGTGNDSVQSVLLTPAEINQNGPVSMEAWVYATSVANNDSVVSYGNSASQLAQRLLEYSANSDGYGAFTTYYGPNLAWTTTPAINEWHYLVATYDGTILNLYQDGVLNGQRADETTPLITARTDLMVGSAAAGGTTGGNQPFTGYIAAARVESGVLTAAEIANNYALGPLATAAALTPSGLTAAAGDGEAVLTWSPPGNAASYNVKSSTSQSGPYSTIAADLDALSFTNTGLSDRTTYYFVVSALNSAGESPNSPAVAAQPVSTAPPVFNFAINDGQLQLIWPQDHTGWSLQAQTNSSTNGIRTNWVAVPASTLTNQVTLPIGLTNDSVFFRLIYP